MYNEKPKYPDPTVIKKYANRRLYNTATSCYITLDDLCEMVRTGEDFLVVDAKSGKDLTHSVLTQIILEQEQGGQNLLPVSFLRHIIRFYGDSMQAFLPKYLEVTMKNFMRNQEGLRAFIGKEMLMPMQHIENMAMGNMTLFEQAMKMFSLVPIGTPATEDKITKLQSKINDLQRELNTLVTDTKPVKKN